MVKRHTKRRKSRRRHPHKGQRSRTRKGRKDFITHKGDKYFNRRRHRQRGRKGRRPFTKRGRRRTRRTSRGGKMGSWILKSSHGTKTVTPHKAFPYGPPK